MLTKKLRVVTLCVMFLMSISMVANAAPMTTNADTMPRSISTGARQTAEVFPGISPTTGLASDAEYRPMMVQISNAKEARPHWNLSEADIVYEFVYWGPAHTRYTAIYNDNHPDYVGGVRSARVTQAELRQEWDCPFVFFGGQEMSGTSIYDTFKINDVGKDFLIDGTRGGKGFFRETSRVSPHNAVANLAEMVAAWPTNEDGTPYESRVHPYTFSTSPTYGVDSAVEIYIPYEEKDYFPSYTFNSSTRMYERWYNGEEQFDGKSGKRIEAANVIVQFARLEFFLSTASRPVITMTGGGKIDAFIDGRHITGTWERNSVNDRTFFLDSSGEEIVMLPGKTFIQVIPESNTFTYVKDDGTEVSVDVGTEVQEATFDPTTAGTDQIDEMEMGELGEGD